MDDFDFLGLCPPAGYTGFAKFADDAHGCARGGGAPYTGLYGGGEPGIAPGTCNVACDGM